jgi:NADPH:quinone reductase-like Zn-dependent oxidoreductase
MLTNLTPQKATMKAITLQNGFGIDHLELIELPIPHPAEDEVLVKLQAASLNAVDLLLIKGALNPNLPLPHIPVADGAGIVEQVGTAVTAFAPGDVVATTFIPDWISGEPTKQALDYATRQGIGTPGQLSEYKVFKVNQLIKAPANLPEIESSTLPVAGLTAWNALQYASVQAGDTVLLHGTGGVSIFALQFAKAIDARVIITSSSDDKLKRAQQMGADLLINYRNTPNWEETVQQLTNGEGVDAVLETVGGKNLQRSLSVLQTGGYISIMGLLGGFETTLNALSLMEQHATIRGMEVGNTQDFDQMNRAIENHNIHPVIDQTFTLEQTQAAFSSLEQGKHFGKIVITI